MNHAQVSAIFAGVSAATFGSGDYCGGVAARRDPVLRVVVVGHALSGCVFLILALCTVHARVAPGQIAAAALAGTASGIGLLALYRGLAVGIAGVVAPLATLFSAAIPVTATLIFRAAAPAPLFWAGLTLAAVAILLLNFDGEIPKSEASGAGERRRRSGAHLGVLAGIGFGVSLAGFAYAGAGHLFGTLAAARVASTLVLGAYALFTGTSFAIRTPLPTLAAACADALGNAAYVAAVAGGDLLIAASITNLYPAVTVALDAAVRRTMPAPLHLAGLVAATAAAITIGISG